MAGGMFGANTEVLRQIAGRFGASDDRVRTAGSTTGAEVESVEWYGPDADAFRADYRGVVTELKALAIVLETKERELIRQADEQDAASLAGGGRGEPRGGGGGGAPSGPGGRSLLDQLLGFYPDIRNPLRGLRFLMEAGFALRNPGAFGSFFTTSWSGITGFVSGSGIDKARGIENLLAASRGTTGRLYRPLKSITDALNFKFASLPLERFLTTHVDAIFNLESGRAQNALHSFLGKEGRLLGRGLGAVAVGMEGFATYQHLQNGEYGAAAYSGAKTVLAGMSFIPGPVGWAAAGASIGLAAYDNIPAVRNTVNAIGSGIADGARAVGGFLSSINPFG